MPLLASICPTSPGYPRCSCSPPAYSSTFLINLSVKKGKYTRNQLTQWSALQFLCCDRKDRQHLCHNLNDHVRHRRSRCEDNVYLKPAEEMFDPIKDINYLFLASARIVSCLGASVSNSLYTQHMKDTDQEEYADPRKNCICWWKCLKVYVKVEVLHDKIPRYTPVQHPDQQLRKTHTVHSRSGRPISSVCHRHSEID